MIVVAGEASLNQSIGKAQKHYSSLFVLPSLKAALVAITVICISTGITSSIFFQTYGGILAGGLLGVAILTLTCSSDLIISQLILKNSIFVFRRTLILSLFSWVFWFLFILLSVLLVDLFGLSGWVKMCLLGFSFVLTLRTIVFFATTSTTFVRRLISILLQPVACIIPFVLFWSTLNIAQISFLPFLIVSPVISIGFGYLFLNLLDRIGKKEYGFPSMALFQAFMLNWVTSENAPLESYLEELGEDTDVEVSLLKFDALKTKAAIIVPLVHPGPFKNIGSSLLPSLLKHAFEKAYGGDICVPLGLLGHERNAASQKQNQKIINSIIESATFSVSTLAATPFVQVRESFVTVSCQLFGRTALLSFTLAPKTTEDLPQELNTIVQEEAKKLGLDASILINAHNSLTDTTEIEASMETLITAACKCLKMAISLQSSSFEIGASTIYPKDFTLKEGMGAGGITALIVKVGKEKNFYIVIDGNNMISGLREKIISSLVMNGFSNGEVFTTDTHAVSALVQGRRGYHPVGEAMNQEALISHIKDCAQRAESNLEICKAGFSHIIIPKIRVMGERSLEPLTLLVDKSIKKAKKIVTPLFGIEALLLILLLSIL